MACITVKELKNYLKELPSELDGFEVVFGEAGKLEDTGNYYRKDTPVQAISADTDTEELIFMTSETYNFLVKNATE